jgi:hypothetical protein
MGDSKRNTKKVNPKVHERKVMFAYFSIAILAWIGLFVMGVFQKIVELFKRD